MKKFFSLVEVTLAIAVVGIGIAGVMALFPVGIQASRDAVGDNYSADSVEQMLVYLASACQDTPASPNNWTTFISNVDEGTATYAPETLPDPKYGYITETPPAILDNNTSTTSNWHAIAGTNLSSISGIGTNFNVYGIKQPSTGNADFTAHIRLWKAPIKNMTVANSLITLPYYQIAGANKIGAVRIYAEVSWPVEKPYSKRTIRVYVMELFKQD